MKFPGFSSLVAKLRPKLAIIISSEDKSLAPWREKRLNRLGGETGGAPCFRNEPSFDESLDTTADNAFITKMFNLMILIVVALFVAIIVNYISTVLNVALAKLSFKSRPAKMGTL